MNFGYDGYSSGYLQLRKSIKNEFYCYESNLNFHQLLEEYEVYKLIN